MTDSRYVFLKTKARADGVIVALIADSEAVISKDAETGTSEKLGVAGALSLRGAFAKANPTGVKGVLTLTQSDLEKRKKELERDGTAEDVKVYQFALDRIEDRKMSMAKPHDSH